MFDGKFKENSLSCHLQTSGNLISNQGWTFSNRMLYSTGKIPYLIFYCVRRYLCFSHFSFLAYFLRLLISTIFLCTFICLCATKLLCSNMKNNFKFIWFSHNILFYVFYSFSEIKLTNFHWKEGAMKRAI